VNKLRVVTNGRVEGGLKAARAYKVVIGKRVETPVKTAAKTCCFQQPFHQHVEFYSIKKGL
jgi:hypothetical protein